MKITDQAEVELRKALESFDKPGSGIHVYSTQGCCGPSIQMDIAMQIGKGETAMSIDGIDFFLSNELLSDLADVTLEYGSNGFRLTGLKKAGSTCCG